MNLTEAMVADMKRSGLTERHVRVIGAITMSVTAVDEFMGGEGAFRFAGYAIPYRDWAGDKTGYVRIRRLEEVRGFGGKIKQLPKYIQKAKTLPQLYISALRKWPVDKKTGLVKIPGNRLIITEGEKKADAACAKGLACVALGGVHAFQSKKGNITLLPEFDKIDYTDLDIEICYDTDASTKGPVRHALEKLAAVLATTKRPKSVSQVHLTPVKGLEVTGLDDYLLHHTDEEYLQLHREADGLVGGLAEISSQVAFINQHGMFYNTKNDRWYQGRNPLTLEFAGRHMVTDPRNPMGDKISAIDIWPEMRDHANTTVDKLVYTPGHAPRSKAQLNLWRPSTLVPKKGSVKLWLELLNHLTSNESKEVRDYLLQWFAYPIQNPGAKLLTAVFLWSDEEGVGKNFLVEPFMWGIYGRHNMGKITVDDLESQFNSYAAKKQFVITDEIFIKNSQARNATMGKLKNLITSPQITVNAKFSPPQDFDNFANYYLTSNHQNALALARRDRRFLVIEAPKKLPDSFYKELDRWAKKDGPAILYHYLLNEVNCEDFNPQAEAMQTIAKREAVLAVAEPVDYYMRLLRREPEKFVAINGILPDKDLYTAAELLKLISIYARDNYLAPLRLSPDSMGRYLSKSLPHSRVNLPGSTLHTRVYALLNQQQWKHRGRDEWNGHVRAVSPKPRRPIS